MHDGRWLGIAPIGARDVDLARSQRGILRAMTVEVSGSDSGVDFVVTLERADLLPGQLASGSVQMTFRDDRDVRGIVAALIATERWQFERTTTDANGHARTETVTERQDLQRLPVQLAGPGRYNRGQTVEFPLKLPVPPLGPATLEATVAGLSWRLEIKADVPGFDPSIDARVVVLQPTALLRAGVVTVGQFALWPSAEAVEGDAKAAIALDPVPLCIGAPFGGLLSIKTGTTKLQEVRLELRAKVKATVSSGRSETITLWTGRVAGEGQFGGAEQAMAFDGMLPSLYVPTVKLPHGEAHAEFHVILAKALARDTHLVRDVAICSTTEI